MGNYGDGGQAPVMCVMGSSQYAGNHMFMHATQADRDRKASPLSLRQAAKNAAKGVQQVFPECNCSKKCLEAQMVNGHAKLNVPPNTNMKYSQIVGAQSSTLRRYLDKLKDALAIIKRLR